MRPLLIGVMLAIACCVGLAPPLQAAMPTPVVVRQEGTQAGKPSPIVARIGFEDRMELNRLVNELDVWEVNHAEGYVVALLAPDRLRSLRSGGTRAEIDVARTARLLPLATAATDAAGVPGFPCYRTVEETYSDLAELAADYPDLASWVDIGDSWAKVSSGGNAGYDIQTLVLTNAALPGPKFRFYLIAAVHAREMATAELVTRFAERLAAGYGVDPDITWLLNTGEVHITPIVNPDGRKRAEAINYWRKNTNDTNGCTDEFPGASYFGVDLNRNSSFRWNGCDGFNCSSSDACFETFRGSGPASEPETQAVQSHLGALFADVRGPEPTDAAPLDASGLFISVHSYSNLVLFPWGWTLGQAPNHDHLRTLGRKFGYFTGYSVCQVGECLYQADGTTDDWAYGELGIASFTFEVGTEFYQSCTAFDELLLERNLAAFLYAFKAARRPYTTPAGPDVRELSVQPAELVILGQPLRLQATADAGRYDSGGYGEQPVQPIRAARVTVDTPSWITGTVAYTMTAVDGSFDAVIEPLEVTLNPEGLTPGRHLLLVEAQDAGGEWGPPAALFVTVSDERRVYLPWNAR